MTIPNTPIYAGTQVVLLVDVRGPDNSLVHPRGSVGVIRRTPTAPGEPFQVRFPDGSELTLSRSEMEVLKHFKGPLTGSAPVADFDLDSCILFTVVAGSRAYGLETEDSDTDRRGVYAAPVALVWSLFGAPEQFEDNDDQTCYWELRKFLVMALRALNTSCTCFAC